MSHEELNLDFDHGDRDEVGPADLVKTRSRRERARQHLAPRTSEQAAAAPDYGRAGRNLPLALGVAVGLLAYLIVSLFWFGWLFIGLVVVALGLGAWELCSVVEATGAKPTRIPLLLGVVVMTIFPYYTYQHSGSLQQTMIVMMGFVTVLVLIPLIWRLFGGTEGYVRDVSASLFIFGYIVVLGASVPLMFAEEHGALRVLIFILVNSVNDTGAYIFGVLFGKHHIVPKISPKKSLEGFLGGWLMSMVFATALMLPIFSTPWWSGLVFGTVIFVLGTLGDLIESIIKRDAGVKDTSSILPGHGGVLDRLDSMLLAAPGAWLVFYLLLTLPAGA